MLITKTKLYEFEATQELKKLIFGEFYGGTIHLKFSVGGGVKEIRVYYAGFDSTRYGFLTSITTGLQELDIEIKEIQARRLYFEIVTDNDITSLEYSISYDFDTITNDYNVSSNNQKYDTAVYYKKDVFLGDSLSLRVPKEDKSTVQSLLVNDVLIDDKKYYISGEGFSEYDINRYLFERSLTRLL